MQPMKPPIQLSRFVHRAYTAAMNTADLHPDTVAMLKRRKSHEKAFEDSQKGRLCAQEAVQSLTGQCAAILTGPARQPVWPDGIIGSITHTKGYAAAIAARRQQSTLWLKGLGYDAETISAVSLDIIHKIATPQEQVWIRKASNPEARLAQLFSMKEALFKALNPETEVAIGFLEIELMPFSHNGKTSAAIIIGMSPRVAAKVDAPDVWIESRIEAGLSLATALWVQGD